MWHSIAIYLSIRRKAAALACQQQNHSIIVAEKQLTVFKLFYMKCTFPELKINCIYSSIQYPHRSHRVVVIYSPAVAGTAQGKV